MFISVNLGKKLYRLLIMPIPLFSMNIFSFRCLIKLSLLSKIMSRCLCESVDEITLLLNIRTGSWVTQRFLEKTISFACFEGSGLNYIFHLKAQLDIRFRSSFSISESLSLSFKTENIHVSSANIFILDWIPSGISLILIKNKKK